MQAISGGVALRELSCWVTSFCLRGARPGRGVQVVRLRVEPRPRRWWRRGARGLRPPPGGLRPPAVFRSPAARRASGRGVKVLASREVLGAVRNVAFPMPRAD